MLTNTKDNTVYQLNILDTPGLEEHRINPEDNREDAALINLAMVCLEKNITFLNVICFVSKAGSTYEQDMATFTKMRGFFG